MQHVRMRSASASRLATCDVIYQTRCRPTEMASNSLGNVQRETAPQGNEHAMLLQEAKSSSGTRHFMEPFDIAQELHSKVLQQALRRLLASVPD